MSTPAQTKRRLRLLLCLGLLIASGWLIAPALAEYFGAGTAEASARITAAGQYEYWEQTGPALRKTSTRRTGNRYTVQFTYEGRQVEKQIDMRRRHYADGSEVHVVFSQSPPHRLVRLNGHWWPAPRLFAGVVLLLLCVTAWLTRNGVRLPERHNQTLR